MEENVNNFDSKTKSSPPEIKYVRPLDRSPDKDFQFRSPEDKKVICYSRSLKAKIHNKINRLENEIDQREKEVVVERKLRQEAEDKYSRYQDMYNSRNVNQELRERLPRANKSDPFKSEENDASETDLSSIEEQIVAEEEDSQASSQPKMKADETNESPVVRRKERRSSRSPRSSPRHSPKSSPKSSRRSLDFSPDKKSGSKVVGETQTAGMDGGSTLPYSSLSPPVRGMYGYSYGASPYLPYTGGLLSGSYPGMSPGLSTGLSPGLSHGLSPGLSASFGSPLMHSSSMLPPSMLQRSMLSPSRNLHPGMAERPMMSEERSIMPERPMTQTLSVPTHASNPNSPSSVSHLTPPTATAPATGATGGATSSPESGLGASGSGNLSAYYRHYFPSSTPNTSALPDPPFIAAGSPRMNLGPGSSLSPNQNNHIASLLNEIDSQRQESRKLRSELQDKESELETLKLTLKVKGVDETREPTNAQQAADLVEEVYAAQRKRDEASTSRMRVCNDERDDAMSRLRQLEARLDTQRGDETSLLQDLSEDEIRLDEYDDNEDVYLMLSKLDTPTSGDQDVSVLMKKVEALRQRQREVTQEEMQIVMEQRDTALARCRKLEEELLRYQREADGGMDHSIKAKLAAIQQERDLAVAKSKQLNDEIQTLRIYYSLHKSLATENSIKQSTNDTAVSGQEDLSVTRHELEAAQKENDRLATQLRTTTIDKKQLEQALESVSQDKERLQRLANVLKRKLNNLTNEEETKQ